MTPANILFRIIKNFQNLIQRKIRRAEAMESWGLVNCFDVAQYTFYDETGLASDEPPPKPPKLATCHSDVPSAKK